MNFRRVGEAGLLVEVGEPALFLATALGERELPGVSDVVPAEHTLLLRFDPRRTDVATLEAAVRATTTSTVELPDETVTLDVVYDGDDLAEAAALAGLDEVGLVAAHTAATWRVMFSGFAPGFGYLRCDDRRLDVPRRDTARTRVPAGAVALAAGYSGVYPTASPGGWQLIGRTDTTLWDLDRDPPALLRPGVRVRFRAV